MDLINTFQNDFTTDITHAFSKQILLGIKALNKFLVNNKHFFSYPEYSALKGYLLNYSIESSLNSAAFTPFSLYRAMPIKVNAFGRSVLHIMTEHFQITIAKTEKWNRLPAKSKYKLEHAQANAHGDRQLYFDFDNNSISSENNLFYALLTYGYNRRTSECSHIDLLIPNSSFDSIIERKNLLPNKNNNLIVMDDYEIENTVASLNDEFERIVTLKPIQNGEN